MASGWRRREGAKDRCLGCLGCLANLHMEGLPQPPPPGPPRHPDPHTPPATPSATPSAYPSSPSSPLRHLRLACIIPNTCAAQGEGYGARQTSPPYYMASSQTSKTSQTHAQHPVRHRTEAHRLRRHTPTAGLRPRLRAPLIVHSRRRGGMALCVRVPGVVAPRRREGRAKSDGQVVHPKRIRTPNLA